MVAAKRASVKTAAAQAPVRPARPQRTFANISKFFIDRPIFAGVLSILMLLAGPLGHVPTAHFRIPGSRAAVGGGARPVPGANPKVIAETVASPLEESGINGVEDMLYMQSQAWRRQPDADGQLRWRGPGTRRSNW